MLKLKYILFIIAAIVSLIYFRVRYVESNEKKKRKQEAVGTYEINLQECILNNYLKDTILIKNFKLYLNPDNTFNFSKNVPFIYDSSGIWAVASVGIYGSNELIYNNSDNYSDQISPCCYENNKIQMKLPLSKKGFEQVKLLVFNKTK